MKNGDPVYPTKDGFIRKARRGETPIGVKIPDYGTVYTGFMVKMMTRDGAEHLIGLDTIPLLYTVNGEIWTYAGKLINPEKIQDSGDVKR